MQPGSYVILFHFQPPLLPLIWPLPILWLPIPLMPEKEHTCQKGFLAVNWAGIYNKSRAASVYRGHLTYAAFQGKAIDWLGRHTSRTAFPLLQLTFIKEFPESYFELRPDPFNKICTAISPFASSLTNQRNSTMTNQNVWFQPIRTVLIGPTRLCKLRFLICIKVGQSGTRVGIYIREPPRHGQGHFREPAPLYPE